MPIAITRYSHYSTVSCFSTISVMFPHLHLRWCMDTFPRVLHINVLQSNFYLLDKSLALSKLVALRFIFMPVSISVRVLKNETWSLIAPTRERKRVTASAATMFAWARGSRRNTDVAILYTIIDAPTPQSSGQVTATPAIQWRVTRIKKTLGYRTESFLRGMSSPPSSTPSLSPSPPP